MAGRNQTVIVESHQNQKRTPTAVLPVGVRFFCNAVICLSRAARQGWCGVRNQLICC